MSTKAADMSRDETVSVKNCEVRLVRLDLPVHRCLVCYSTNVVTFAATEKWAWQKRQIANSLCQIWSLPNNPFEEKIRRVSYCDKCYEKILNVNVIFRKIKTFQTKLLDAQCKIEEEILKSNKMYKAEENKFNMPLPWDDVRKKIISGLSCQNEVPLEEEDSEDRAFLAWAEGNSSNHNSNDTKTPIVNNKSTKAGPAGRKKEKKQQTVNFSQALTVLRNPPSSPGALSDSDIFKEIIETTTSDKLNISVGSGSDPSSQSQQFSIATENNLETPLENEIEQENIFATSLSQMLPSSAEEQGTDADSNNVPLVPCTVSGCRKKFKNSILLVGHTKRFHEGIEKPYMCDFCGYAFAIYQDLKNHRSSHFSDRPLMCQYCGKRFKQLRYLKDHLTLHQNGQTYKCKVCEKEFPGPSMLRVHLNMHKTDRGYICEVCSAEFKSLQLLKFHLAKHESPARLIVCEFCPGKTFANPRNLRIHMKRHNDDFDVRCPVCNMGLENQTRLKSHMISHSDDLTYFCDICRKGFKHKDSLNLHKKMHIMRDNDDRPFQCSICNKRFLCKRNLIRHSVRHDPKNNPYRCQLCDQSFPVYHFLKTHVKKCHADKIGTSKTDNDKSSVQEKLELHRDTALQYLNAQEDNSPKLSASHNQQIHLNLSPENLNMESVTLQISMQPQAQVNIDAQAQQVVDSIVKHVNLEGMVQVSLDQMTQPLRLDSITQQVNLDPLVQQVNLDSITQQINLEPLTQVSLESIGHLNLDSIGQLNLESLRQVNVESMSQVNLSHMGHITIDSMGQLSRVNVGPMGEVNIEPLTAISIDSIPQINLENIQQMNLDSLSRINLEPMSQINLDSMSINLDSINQANILPMDHVHLDSIGQQDIEHDDSSYFESVSIEENDSNEMVSQNVAIGPSCMFEVMDIGSIGMEMGPMEMEASPATTLMETLASYYSDI